VVKSLTTLDHPSVSIHVDSGENERKKESGRMERRRVQRVTVMEEKYPFPKILELIDYIT
jgi:hypothetical protein